MPINLRRAAHNLFEIAIEGGEIVIAAEAEDRRDLIALFHYPAHSGGAILLSALAGVLIFHDKLSRRQIAVCVLGLLAIVLMNF